MGGGREEGEYCEHELGGEYHAGKLSAGYLWMVEGSVRTYNITTVHAKAPFACWQYPMSFWSCATEQGLEMYHGAPRWGRLGSLISEPA